MSSSLRTAKHLVGRGFTPLLCVWFTFVPMSAALAEDRGDRLEAYVDSALHFRFEHPPGLQVRYREPGDQGRESWVTFARPDQSKYVDGELSLWIFQGASLLHSPSFETMNPFRFHRDHWVVKKNEDEQLIHQSRTPSKTILVGMHRCNAPDESRTVPPTERACLTGVVLFPDRAVVIRDYAGLPEREFIAVCGSVGFR